MLFGFVASSLVFRAQLPLPSSINIRAFSKQNLNYSLYDNSNFSLHMLQLRSVLKIVQLTYGSSLCNIYEPNLI